MAMAAVAERFSWRAALTGPGYMALLVALLIMVVIKVSVHPAGLGPKEAGKAWYSSCFITHMCTCHSEAT